jgi:hypothetical protein
MAFFSLEEGMRTETFSVSWALRIRVNISAMGSLMLILSLPYQLALTTPGISPFMAIHADHVAAQAELAEHTTRAAGELATVAQTALAGVAGQGLKLHAGIHALSVSRA